MNKTLFGKILLMSFIIILVVSGVTAVVMNFFIKQYVLYTKEQEMLRQGQRVAKAVNRVLQRPEEMGMGLMRSRTMWVMRVNKTIGEMEAVVGGKIWFVDSEGQIYLDAPEGRQLHARELDLLMKGHSITKVDWTDERNNAIMAVAIPLRFEGEVFGGLFIVTPMQDIRLVQVQIRKILVSSAFIGAIAAVIIAFFFSRHLTLPVYAMQKQIARMRQGDFSGRLEVRREDELGELARHFNDLNRELRQTIELLSTEKEQTQRIIYSMTEGMISLNQKGKIVVMNPAARRMLQAGGKDEHDPEGILDNLPGLPELVEQIWQENTPLLREIHHNGLIYHATGSPINTGEQISGVVLILRDVTNRWRLVEMQRELVANVSHEFKTPLTSIRGFVELLLDNKISDQGVLQNSLKIIHQETSRLTRMVNDLLQMARLEAHRLRKEPTDLSVLVQKVVENLQLKLNEAKVEVVADDTLQRQVVVDADRMEQVFYNLIDNAIRFSPVGTAIELNCAENGDKLEVTIRDHGPGVPEAEQEVIFDRFYKVGKARSSDDSGSGLGLAIVRNIIEEHGGQIWVENHPEGGAVFTLQLMG